MPNTVVKLTNAESTWLEAAREDRKLLINMKAHLQRCAFCFAFIWSGVQSSGFKGEEAVSPPFLEDGILVSQPSSLGNAIKLRKSLAT